MEMIFDKIKIHAHLKPENSKDSCLDSDSFRKGFINNDTLPEFIQQIPVHEISANDEPMIMIYDGEKEIFILRKHKLNPSIIIGFLMKYMELQIL